MSSILDEIRHENQRGVILRVLLLRYPEATPFSDLRAQLARGQGYPMSEDELRFHLAYLSERGYVETERLRLARPDQELTLVRITAKGIDLYDGRLAPDAGVVF